MCCKGHCNLDGSSGTPEGDIAAYMSHECACPKEDYRGKTLEWILREALFDYFATADNPSFELRQLLYRYASFDPSLSERMIAVFQLARVRDSNGGCVNGFTDKLIAQSEIDLNEKQRKDEQYAEAEQ